jgi:hypothetical protein
MASSNIVTATFGAASIAIRTWPTGRAEIERHIQSVWSLAEYIEFLNKDDDVFPLDDNLENWAEQGIKTAAQLGDYLDGCCAHNVEQSQMYG